MTLTSVENGVPKGFKHLGNFTQVSVVASCSYVTQRQNPPKVVSFSFDVGKETWKNSFQKTKTSGTYRCQIQTVHQNH